MDDQRKQIDIPPLRNPDRESNVESVPEPQQPPQPQRRENKTDTHNRNLQDVNQQGQSSQTWSKPSQSTHDSHSQGRHAQDQYEQDRSAAQSQALAAAQFAEWQRCTTKEPHPQPLPVEQEHDPMNWNSDTKPDHSRSMFQQYLFPSKSKAQTDDNDITQKLRKAEQMLTDAAREIHGLKSELQSVQFGNYKLHNEATTRNYKLCYIQEQLATSQGENSQLKEEIAHLRKDNGELRTYIVEMESGRGPVHDEEYYILNFEEIKGDIRMWIAKHSKANARQELMPEAETEILDGLAKLGKHGQVSSEFFKFEQRTIRSLYNNGRARIALIRHVVALFLFHHVFQPHTFALPQNVSDILQWVGRQILNREQLSNILATHQAIGRAALIYAKDQVGPFRDSVIVQLRQALHLLLPASREEDIQRFVEKVIDKAIVLKNSMTEEQAIYHCFWPDCGSGFDECYYEVAEEGQNGNVFACTFPGLARTIKKTDKEVSVVVVKASAVLESAFQPQE